MGCRTRVFENRYGEKTSVGRGNLSFSTLNIVRMAIECMAIRTVRSASTVFFSKLDYCLDVTARQLCDRFELPENSSGQAVPLLMSRLGRLSDIPAPTTPSSQ